jgi:hypothetical protein
MMLKRNVAIPDMAPVTRSRDGSIPSDIANMVIGESGIIARSAPALRSVVKSIVAKLADVGDIRHYAVWPSNSDGSAIETGHTFALIARLDEATAAKYESQRAGSVISGRVA